MCVYDYVMYIYTYMCAHVFVDYTYTHNLVLWPLWTARGHISGALTLNSSLSPKGVVLGSLSCSIISRQERASRATGCGPASCAQERSLAAGARRKDVEKLRHVMLSMIYSIDYNMFLQHGIMEPLQGSQKKCKFRSEGNATTQCSLSVMATRAMP